MPYTSCFLPGPALPGYRFRSYREDSGHRKSPSIYCCWGKDRSQWRSAAKHKDSHRPLSQTFTDLHQNQHQNPTHRQATLKSHIKWKSSRVFQFLVSQWGQNLEEIDLSVPNWLKKKQRVLFSPGATLSIGNLLGYTKTQTEMFWHLHRQIHRNACTYSHTSTQCYIQMYNGHTQVHHHRGKRLSSAGVKRMDNR